MNDRLTDTVASAPEARHIAHSFADLRSMLHDKSYRIGGEEFAVLLQGADSGGALVTAERLRHAIAEQPVAVDGGLIPVTVSVGIAIARHVGETDALLGAADAALYRAKAEGRNRVIMAGDEGRVGSSSVPTFS